MPDPVYMYIYVYMRSCVNETPKARIDAPYVCSTFQALHSTYMEVLD
jgi:hypothetical protein